MCPYFKESAVKTQFQFNLAVEIYTCAYKCPCYNLNILNNLTTSKNWLDANLVRMIEYTFYNNNIENLLFIIHATLNLHHLFLVLYTRVVYVSRRVVWCAALLTNQTDKIYIIMEGRTIYILNLAGGPHCTTHRMSPCI